jgi:hypothetical protein
MIKYFPVGWLSSIGTEPQETQYNVKNCPLTGKQQQIQNLQYSVSDNVITEQNKNA